MLEAVEMEWTTFNDIFPPDEYSGYPSQSSEAAWAKLWGCELGHIPDWTVTIIKPLTSVGAFSVPLDMIASLNKSSLDGDFRLVDKEHGGGVGGLLEGAHQIHCLVSITVWKTVQLRNYNCSLT